ncbi:dynein axonemal heavy chain 10-like isoform X2 [Artemia franciscana]
MTEDISKILPRLVEALGVAASLGWDQDVEVTVKLIEKVSDTVARWAQKNGDYTHVLSTEAQKQNKAILEVLEIWRSSCIDEVLKKNELLWEATDEETFFEATSNVACILKELIEYSDVLNNLGLLFGDEMQTLNNHSSELTGLETTYTHIISIFTSLKYNPFLLESSEKWTQLRMHYKSSLEDLTTRSLEFLKASFENSSSTKAISMLQYLSIGRFSEELQTLLKSQRVFVFHRINQEIKEAEQFFENDGVTEELFFPPSAGAIFRERLLFQGIRTSVIKGLAIEGDADEELKQQVTENFERLAKRFRKFEDFLLGNFCNFISTELQALLYTPILRKRGGFYEVNFPEKLATVIDEAYFMILLQLEVPERAQLLVMKKAAWFLDCQTLGDFLREFHNTVEKLQEHEEVLLAPKIDAIEREMLKGCKFVTWSSGCLKKYLKDLNEPVDALRDAVIILEDQSLKIEEQIREIEQETIHMDMHTLYIKDYVAKCLQDGDMVIERVASLVSSIEANYNNLKDKLQENEFDHQRFVRFVVHVNDRCINVVSKVLLSSLMDYLRILNSSNPVMVVFLRLSEFYPRIYPPFQEIYQLLNSVPQGFIERTKKVIMHEVCYHHDDSAAGSKWNFLGKLKENQEIISLNAKIQARSRELVEEVEHQAKIWRVYESLWKSEKLATVRIFRKTNPTIESWDEKFQFYLDLIEDLRVISHDKYCGPIQINQEDMVQNSIDHCKEWIKVLGNSIQQVVIEKSTKYMENRKESHDNSNKLQDAELNVAEILNMLNMMNCYNIEVKPEVIQLVQEFLPGIASTKPLNMPTD